MCHNYWTGALEPACWNYWNSLAWSLCLATREATAMTSLCTSTREESLLATTRESPRAAMKTQCNQNKNTLIKKKKKDTWESHVHKGQAPIHLTHLLQSLQLVLQGLLWYLHFDHLLSESFILVFRFSSLFLHGFKFMVQSDRYIFGHLHQPTDTVIWWEAFCVLRAPPNHFRGRITKEYCVTPKSKDPGNINKPTFKGRGISLKHEIHIKGKYDFHLD